MRLSQTADWISAINELAATRKLRNHRGLPVRFVPQSYLPEGAAYESHISATGNVPTRENLHDFFNALIWLRYPRIKVRLNELQAAQITTPPQAGDPTMKPVRGKLRDAATIFDENAAIFVATSPESLEALRLHRWEELFCRCREKFWEKCHVSLFGHALLEKLVSPYKSMTAHAWLLLADSQFNTWTAAEKDAWIDQTMVSQLNETLTTRLFTPLPIMGLPGWWHPQDIAFYEDKAVFRPKRVLSTAT